MEPLGKRGEMLWIRLRTVYGVASDCAAIGGGLLVSQGILGL